MFGKKHKDTATPADPQDDGQTMSDLATNLAPAEDASHEAFSLDEGAATGGASAFSDKDPEERAEEILTAQANLRKIREETHDAITEHTDTEREDTVDKAHERGEL